MLDLGELIRTILGPDYPRSGKRRTMLNKERLFNSRKLVIRAENEKIPGSIVECGTWLGGGLAFMAYALVETNSKKEIYGFDTFTHIPKTTIEDGKHLIHRGHENDLKSSIEEVHKTFELCGLSKDQPKLIKGLFQDTLPKNKEKIGPIAVLRLDGDWYESTKVCLEELYDQVSIGGFIIIDDYGHFPGCRQAVHEFLRGKGIGVKELQVTDATERWWQKKT